MKILVCIDAQEDFTRGTLRNEEAIKTIPNLVEKVKTYTEEHNSYVVFTKDTHNYNYMLTLEGKKLPVPHCIRNTEGWNLIKELNEYSEKGIIVDKYTFGSTILPIQIDNLANEFGNIIEEIEIVGYCTDICVISNALIIRAHFPNIPITVDASCCAGVTPEKHKAALEVMKSCQIDVINE
jgi:nicotinamidase-related amidase